jgi:sugar (pentulose or hexulose) kinase
MWMLRWLLSIIVLVQTTHIVTVQALAAAAMTMTTKQQQQFVGFDLGTSGARISVIEQRPTTAASASTSTDEDTTTTTSSSGGQRQYHYKEVYTKSIMWSETTTKKGGAGTYDDPDAWIQAVEIMLRDAAQEQGLGGGGTGLQNVASICVSGTSASCLLMDRSTLQVTRSPRMYDYNVVEMLGNGNGNENQSQQRAMELLDQYAPPRHTARARTGSLAKLLAWQTESPLTKDEVLCHQSDFITTRLLGQHASPGVVKSDWHNCLKLGYDARQNKWPEWIENCLISAGISNPLGRRGQGDEDGAGAAVIPLQVVSPGQPIGTICSEMSESLGLPKDTVLVGGTTDSNAAFFAAAGTKPSFGTAVTSLGSTLAMKQLSQTYVEDADRGVYSHRFPTFSDDGGKEQEQAACCWLVGGASNVGCAVLRKLEFGNDELDQLSKEIDPMTDSPLSYYPLTKKGERFPVADGNKEPVLEPVPASRKEYLHGILQSIGDVERDGFLVLQELGAPPPTVVWTCGGGSRNDMWSKMRERRLAASFGGENVSVRRADCTEASFGAALLAAATFT